MATKKNVKAVDYNDAEQIKAYCENDIVECDDWKARLKQEYDELKERYEKLRKYNTKNRVEYNEPEVKAFYSLTTDEKKVAYYKRRRSELLETQEEVIESYIRVLEQRMTLEGIDY
jgi:chromosome segregation ATPase